MIKNIFNGASGYISYRGGAGHLAFVMHRISGLGTVVFLSMHIVLESTAHFAPHLYNRLNADLRNPAALVAEILLAFFVIFHGVNGFRIAYSDLFRVDFWSLPSGSKSAEVCWIISFILWIPTLIIMMLHSLNLI